MATCKVCLRSVKKLRFDTGRAAVCGRCVSSLNARPAVAEDAQRRLGDMLQRGIARRATESLGAPDEWRRARAQRELGDLEGQTARALPGWLNRLLADPKNTSRDFKLLRAHRRHLLHFDRPHGWGYPGNWKEVAARVRALDDFRCTACGRDDTILDVHHIIYVFHFGTHRQENLATLCRPCHEAEHGRVLDFGEAVGSDQPPSGAGFFAEPVALADDDDSAHVIGTLLPEAQPDLAVQVDQWHAATHVPAALPVQAMCAAPPPSHPAPVGAAAVPRSLPDAAWCIVACHHCRRSQRVFVVGDDSAVECVFCSGTFFPGQLRGLRRAGW